MAWLSGTSVELARQVTGLIPSAWHNLLQQRGRNCTPSCAPWIRDNSLIGWLNRYCFYQGSPPQYHSDKCHLNFNPKKNRWCSLSTLWIAPWSTKQNREGEQSEQMCLSLKQHHLHAPSFMHTHIFSSCPSSEIIPQKVEFCDLPTLLKMLPICFMVQINGLVKSLWQRNIFQINFLHLQTDVVLSSVSLSSLSSVLHTLQMPHSVSGCVTI